MLTPSPSCSGRNARPCVIAPWHLPFSLWFQAVYSIKFSSVRCYTEASTTSSVSLWSPLRLRRQSNEFGRRSWPCHRRFEDVSDAIEANDTPVLDQSRRGDLRRLRRDVPRPSSSSTGPRIPGATGKSNTEPHHLRVSQLPFTTSKRQKRDRPELVIAAATPSASSRRSR